MSCGNSSHVVTFYFQWQPLDILFKRVPEMCVSVCAILSAVSSSSHPKAPNTVVCAVQSAVKTHSVASHIFLFLVWSVCTTSPCQCHKSCPRLMAMICQNDTMLQYRVWAGLDWERLIQRGSELATLFPCCRMRCTTVRPMAISFRAVSLHVVPVSWSALKTAPVFPVVTHWSH